VKVIREWNSTNLARHEGHQQPMAHGEEGDDGDHEEPEPGKGMFLINYQNASKRDQRKRKIFSLNMLIMSTHWTV
jgi:hypothetical protein